MKGNNQLLFTKQYLKRIYVLKKQNWKCSICESAIDVPHKRNWLRPSWDHYIPISKGGKLGFPNKKVAHYMCNCLKGDLNIEEARQLLSIKYIKDCIDSGIIPRKSELKKIKLRRKNESSFLPDQNH